MTHEHAQDQIPLCHVCYWAQVYTPAPWHYDRIGNNYNQYSVYQVGNGENVAQVVEGEANAKLIAAAPELLQLLQEAFAVIDNSTEILFNKGLQENEEYIDLTALLAPMEQLIHKATN